MTAKVKRFARGGRSTSARPICGTVRALRLVSSHYWCVLDHYHIPVEPDGADYDGQGRDCWFDAEPSIVSAANREDALRTAKCSWVLDEDDVVPHDDTGQCVSFSSRPGLIDVPRITLVGPFGDRPSAEAGGETWRRENAFIEHFP